MDQPAAEPTTATPDGAGNRYRRRARFETIFASIWLAIGLFPVSYTHLTLPTIYSV